MGRAIERDADATGRGALPSGKEPTPLDVAAPAADQFAGCGDCGARIRIQHAAFPDPHVLGATQYDLSAVAICQVAGCRGIAPCVDPRAADVEQYARRNDQAGRRVGDRWNHGIPIDAFVHIARRDATATRAQVRRNRHVRRIQLYLAAIRHAQAAFHRYGFRRDGGDLPQTDTVQPAGVQGNAAVSSAGKGSSRLTAGAPDGCPSWIEILPVVAYRS